MEKIDKLYLDDLRTPDPIYEFDVVRNYNEFIEYIQTNGIPDLISFDFDLDQNKYEIANSLSYRNGLDCVKWLFNYADKHKIDISNVRFYTHSANPLGRESIQQYIKEYFIKHKVYKDIPYVKWDHIKIKD